MSHAMFWVEGMTMVNSMIAHISVAQKPGILLIAKATKKKKIILSKVKTVCIHRGTGYIH